MPPMMPQQLDPDAANAAQQPPPGIDPTQGGPPDDTVSVSFPRSQLEPIMQVLNMLTGAIQGVAQQADQQIAQQKMALQGMPTPGVTPNTQTPDNSPAGLAAEIDAMSRSSR
jgi:hypothetical protein